MYVQGHVQIPLTAALSPEYYQRPLQTGYPALEGTPLLYPYVAVPGFDPTVGLAESFEQLAVGPTHTGPPPPRPYPGWPPGARDWTTPQAPIHGHLRANVGGQNWDRGWPGRSDSGQTRPHNRARDTRQQQQQAQAVKRTVYICDIDPQVTEAGLAELFGECGSVVDARVCGDPHTAMRFAFIEFEDESAVPKAIKLSGRVVGSYPLRVRPSKTAIVPVNRTYLPRTDAERELCNRTVYAANIDKKVDGPHIRQFFESLCGPVSKLRLLGDSHHSTRIAFVEFCGADSAQTALSCSGALLGSLPIRIAPSKTPVRGNPRT